MGVRSGTPGSSVNRLTQTFRGWLPLASLFVLLVLGLFWWLKDGDPPGLQPVASGDETSTRAARGLPEGERTRALETRAFEVADGDASGGFVVDPQEPVPLVRDVVRVRVLLVDENGERPLLEGTLGLGVDRQQEWRWAVDEFFDGIDLLERRIAEFEERGEPVPETIRRQLARDNARYESWLQRIEARERDGLPPRRWESVALVDGVATVEGVPRSYVTLAWLDVGGERWLTADLEEAITRDDDDRPEEIVFRVPVPRRLELHVRDADLGHHLENVEIRMGSSVGYESDVPAEDEEGMVIVAAARSPVVLLHAQHDSHDFRKLWVRAPGYQSKLLEPHAMLPRLEVDLLRAATLEVTIAGPVAARASIDVATDPPDGSEGRRLLAIARAREGVVVFENLPEGRVRVELLGRKPTGGVAHADQRFLDLDRHVTNRVRFVVEERETPEVGSIGGTLRVPASWYEEDADRRVAPPLKVRTVDLLPGGSAWSRKTKNPLNPTVIEVTPTHSLFAIEVRDAPLGRWYVDAAEARWKSPPFEIEAGVRNEVALELPEVTHLVVEPRGPDGTTPRRLSVRFIPEGDGGGRGVTLLMRGPVWRRLLLTEMGAGVLQADAPGLIARKPIVLSPGLHGERLELGLQSGVDVHLLREGAREDWPAGWRLIARPLAPPSDAVVRGREGALQLTAGRWNIVIDGATPYAWPPREVTVREGDRLTLEYRL